MQDLWYVFTNFILFGNACHDLQYLLIHMVRKDSPLYGEIKETFCEPPFNHALQKAKGLNECIKPFVAKALFAFTSSSDMSSSAGWLSSYFKTFIIIPTTTSEFVYTVEPRHTATSLLRLLFLSRRNAHVFSYNKTPSMWPTTTLWNPNIYISL